MISTTAYKCKDGVAGPVAGRRHRKWALVGAAPALAKSGQKAFGCLADLFASENWDCHLKYLPFVFPQDTPS